METCLFTSPRTECQIWGSWWIATEWTTSGCTSTMSCKVIMATKSPEICRKWHLIGTIKSWVQSDHFCVFLKFKYYNNFYDTRSYMEKNCTSVYLSDVCTNDCILPLGSIPSPASIHLVATDDLKNVNFYFFDCSQLWYRCSKKGKSRKLKRPKTSPCHQF